jgi:hypothetical protein
MNYSLWIEDKSQGPYDIEQIRQMLKDRAITTQTLCLPEGSSGDEWHPIANVVPLYYAKPVGAQSVQVPSSSAFSARRLSSSGTASALQIMAILEFVAAPIAGVAVGSENGSLGFIIFISGILSGILMLGFARVVEYLYETAQRLRHIESILEQDRETKGDA